MLMTVMPPLDFILSVAAAWTRYQIHSLSLFLCHLDPALDSSSPRRWPPFERANNRTLCFVAGEPGALPLPLAEPQCQAQRRGRHGAAQQDQRGRHRGEPQEEIHG